MTAIFQRDGRFEQQAFDCVSCLDRRSEGWVGFTEIARVDYRDYGMDTARVGGLVLPLDVSEISKLPISMGKPIGDLVVWIGLVRERDIRKEC